MRVTKKLLPGVVMAFAATAALALSACAPTAATPDASGSGAAGPAEEEAVTAAEPRDLPFDHAA